MRKKGQHKKRRESTDEFCKRLGIIQHKGEKGGQEFSPYHRGNLSPKKPVPEQQNQRST